MRSLCVAVQRRVPRDAQRSVLCLCDVAVSEDGDVHFWGWRLKAVPLPLTAGLRVLDLAVGYGHTLAIVRED